MSGLNGYVIASWLIHGISWCFLDRQSFLGSNTCRWFVFPATHSGECFGALDSSQPLSILKIYVETGGRTATSVMIFCQGFKFCSSKIVFATPFSLICAIVDHCVFVASCGKNLIVGILWHESYWQPASQAIASNRISAKGMAINVDAMAGGWRL